MSRSWIILTLVRLWDRLSVLLPQDRDIMVEKLGAKTVMEQKRAEELRRVLDAKKELAKARAENTRLRGEIARVTETNTDGAEPPKPKRTSFITKA